MKLRLPVLVGAVILGTGMAVMAGSNNATRIIGVWQLTKSDGKVVPPEKGVVTLEFAKDGKIKGLVKVKAGDKDLTLNFDGTYTLKDDKITSKMTFGGKTKEEVHTIKKLTDTEWVSVDEKGKVEEFKRVK